MRRAQSAALTALSDFQTSRLTESRLALALCSLGCAIEDFVGHGAWRLPIQAHPIPRVAAEHL